MQGSPEHARHAQEDHDDAHTLSIVKERLVRVIEDLSFQQEETESIDRDAEAHQGNGRSQVSQVRAFICKMLARPASMLRLGRRR